MDSISSSDLTIKGYLKFVRYLKPNVLMIILNGTSQRDQMVVVEFSSTANNLYSYVTKIKPLDFQIGKISNIQIISKVDSEQDRNLHLLLVDNKGGSMSLQLTPKTYRAMLPTRQNLSPYEGKVLSSEIIIMGNFFVIANKNETHMTVSIIKKDTFAQIYTDVFDKHIEGLTGYTYTESYSLVLFSVKPQGTTLAKTIEGIHISQPEKDYYVIKEDPDIFTNNVGVSQVSVNSLTGQMYILKDHSVGHAGFKGYK